MSTDKKLLGMFYAARRGVSARGCRRICESTEPAAVLARRYGVSANVIYAIRKEGATQPEETPAT